MSVRYKIAYFMVFVLMVGLLAACVVQPIAQAPAPASAPAAAPAEELAVEAKDWPLAKDVKLCWITALGHPYGVAKTELGAKEASLMGFTLDIYDSTQDIQTEIAMVEDCVSQQYDVIIMTPYDPTALNAAIQKAVDAGIPVIVEGAALDEQGTALVSSVIGSNGILEGIAAGEMICAALGEAGGNWVMIEGAAGHALVPQRGGEAERVVSEQCPNVQLLAKQTGEWDRAKSRTVMENFLTAYPDQINLVYCHDGNMCFGAEEAIKEAGLLGQIKIIGINGNKEEYDAIRSGNWYGTVLNDASWISINAVQRSRDLVENRPILKEYISPADKVTQENVDQFTAWW